MKKFVTGAALLALSLGSAAQAQDSVYWPAPVSSGARMRMMSFPMGTPLALITRTQVSTKDNKSGDRIYLEVAESLSYQGQVVVPAGSVAVAEVSRADRNGHFGKKGKLDVRLLYIETPNGRVRLTGRGSDEGVSGTAASVATIAFVSVLGFLIHGTSAYLPAGTPITAYLAEDLSFPVNPAMAQGAPSRPVGTLPARFDPTVFSSNNAR